MPKALLLFQQAQLSDAQVRQLDALVRQLYHQHVSPAKLLTIWNSIPEGQAFTNYRDSRSAIATIECPNDFPQDRRVEMLVALDSAWRAITGQKPEELMLSLVEKDMFAEIYAGNRQRLSPGGQLKFAWHILRGFLRARRRGTPLLINPNL